MYVNEATADARQVNRDDCLIAASIVFGDSRIFCTLRNISECGAKILLGLGQPIPKNFALHVLDMPGFQEPKRCEMRWRIGNVVGVRFTAPNALPTNPG